MAHSFTFTLVVEVERVSGKFVSRDEIAEHIMEQLEGNEPDVYGIGPDGDTDYDVVTFDISEAIEVKTKRK